MNYLFKEFKWGKYGSSLNTKSTVPQFFMLTQLYTGMGSASKFCALISTTETNKIWLNIDEDRFEVFEDQFFYCTN